MLQPSLHYSPCAAWCKQHHDQPLIRQQPEQQQHDRPRVWQQPENRHSRRSKPRERPSKIARKLALAHRPSAPACAKTADAACMWVCTASIRVGAANLPLLRRRGARMLLRRGSLAGDVGGRVLRGHVRGSGRKGRRRADERGGRPASQLLRSKFAQSKHLMVEPTRFARRGSCTTVDRRWTIQRAW